MLVFDIKIPGRTFISVIRNKACRVILINTCELILGLSSYQAANAQTMMQKKTMRAQSQCKAIFQLST